MLFGDFVETGTFSDFLGIFGTCLRLFWYFLDLWWTFWVHFSVFLDFLDFFVKI